MASGGRREANDNIGKWRPGGQANNDQPMTKYWANDNNAAIPAGEEINGRENEARPMLPMAKKWRLNREEEITKRQWRRSQANDKPEEWQNDNAKSSGGNSMKKKSMVIMTNSSDEYQWQPPIVIEIWRPSITSNIIVAN